MGTTPRSVAAVFSGVERSISETASGAASDGDTPRASNRNDPSCEEYCERSCSTRRMGARDLLRDPSITSWSAAGLPEAKSLP